MKTKHPINASHVPEVAQKSIYPAPFADVVKGRTKRRLGDYFDLENFGVNLTVLEPGCQSALHHAHEKQDEIIYVLEGKPLLVLGGETFRLEPGMVAGFPKGAEAHHLLNDTDEDVHILEIGDRTAGDQVTYPNDDLQADMRNGAWVFTHKDGTPYDD